MSYPLRKKLIFEFISKYFKKRIILFSIIAFLSAIFYAPIPFIYRTIIDGVITTDLSKLFYFILIYAVLIIISVVLEYLHQRLITSYQHRVMFTVLTQVYKKILSYPYSVISKKDSGDIIKLLQNDGWHLHNLITFGIIKIITIGIQFCVNLIILFYLFGWQVVFIIGVLPVYYLLIKKASENVELYGYKYERAENEWARDAYSPLYMLKEVKSRRIEEYLNSKIIDSSESVQMIGIKRGIASSLLYSYHSFFDKGLYLLVFIYGIYSVGSGTMSLGTLFAVLYVLSSAISNFNSFSLAIKDDFFKRLPSIDRLVELFSYSSKEGNKSPDTIRNTEISFENVHYTHHDSSFSLTIPSLTLKSGNKYVLIGLTGAGKSTFFDLLNGILTPQKGVIRIADTPTEDIKHSWWKSNVFVILQESTIFRGNIFENIVLGDKDINEHELKKLITKHNLGGFFKRFKYGIKTEPKEGKSLSGGEKRMISVLRLLLNPHYPIVLIDEMKAGLDVELRNKLDDILEGILKDRLSVTITHDLEEISKFDQVIYINNGKVILGKHYNLINDNASYKQFVLNNKGDNK